MQNYRNDWNSESDVCADYFELSVTVWFRNWTETCHCLSSFDISFLKKCESKQLSELSDFFKSFQKAFWLKISKTGLTETHEALKKSNPWFSFHFCSKLLQTFSDKERKWSSPLFWTKVSIEVQLENSCNWKSDYFTAFKMLYYRNVASFRP